MLTFAHLDTPLTASGVRLRAAAERDIPEILIAHQDDPELHAALGLERPPSGAELGRQVEREAADRSAGVAAWLTILDTDSDRCRGQVSVHDVDRDHLRAQLTVWIVPEHRGAGLGAAALAAAGGWLLTVCGLQRVELLVDPALERLTRAALRAGFHAEGTMRGYRRDPAGEGRRDTAVLSLIAADVAQGES